MTTPQVQGLLIAWLTVLAHLDPECNWILRLAVLSKGSPLELRSAAVATTMSPSVRYFGWSAPNYPSMDARTPSPRRQPPPRLFVGRVQGLLVPFTVALGSVQERIYQARTSLWIADRRPRGS